MVMKTSASGIPSSLWKVDLNNGFDEALCTRRSKYKASNYFTCGYSSTPNVSSAFLMKHTMSTMKHYFMGQEVQYSLRILNSGECGSDFGNR